LIESPPFVAWRAGEVKGVRRMKVRPKDQRRDAGERSKDKTMKSDDRNIEGLMMYWAGVVCGVMEGR
jgi:hypothetical protein